MREYSIGKVGGLEPSIPSKFISLLSQIGAEKQFDKGDLIYRQGEEADFIYFLLKGRVKVTLTGASGQEAILRIHLPHSFLGLTALASDPLRDANGMCMDQASLVAIGRHDFHNFMLREPLFAVHIVRLLTDRMSDFHYRVGDWLTQPVEKRLSHALLALSAPDVCNNNEGAQEVPLTHEELAQIVNTRRPTVSRALSKLAGLNLVKQLGRKLVVPDRVRLSTYANSQTD